eukprot:15297980-Alexandrium_andersonii.AAC.1
MDRAGDPCGAHVRASVVVGAQDALPRLAKERGRRLKDLRGLRVLEVVDARRAAELRGKRGRRRRVRHGRTNCLGKFLLATGRQELLGEVY